MRVPLHGPQIDGEARTGHIEGKDMGGQVDDRTEPLRTIANEEEIEAWLEGDHDFVAVQVYLPHSKARNPLEAADIVVDHLKFMRDAAGRQ